MKRQEDPEDTGGPPVMFDRESTRALFPPVDARLATAWRELTSALGRDGVKALVVYLACGAVLVFGIVVVAVTWVSTERVPGAVFWFVYAGVVGTGGWFLSGQAEKRWLRTFVGVSVLVSIVLLITIGRNAHIRAARDAAEAEALGLLAADTWSGISTDSSAESALLAMLCRRGGLETGGDASPGGSGGGNDECTVTENGSGDRQIAYFDEDEVAAPRYSQKLDCLAGWTVGTFVEWTEEASSHRQVAALSALASCEIRVASPVAEEEAADEIQVVSAPADDAATDAGDANGIEPTDDSEAGDDGVGEAGADGSDDGDSSDGPDGDASAGGESEPTEEAIAAVRAALQVQRSELSAQQAVSAGADELLTFASGNSEFEQLRFSATVWLVVVAAALLWYRKLEIRAGAYRLGPVDVQFDVPTDSPHSKKGEAESRPPRTRAEAVFKESVIRNVPEPGAIPGGEALAPVGDLVAQTDVPHRTLISGVIEAATTLLATRGGFTVVFSVRRSDDGKEHVAFVRLRDTRTGHHLASHVVYDEVEEQAARCAGYWIAGWIIHRSNYVPSWAQWSEEDAASFPPRPPAWSPGVQPAAQHPVRPDEFDPNTLNSLILAQRAYAYQTTPSGPEGTGHAGRRNHFAALEDIARAVHRARRYPVARYRRGAALGTMMFRGGDLASAAGLWPGASKTARAQRLPSADRLRHLLLDLLMDDRRRPVTASDRADVEGWIRQIVEDKQAWPRVKKQPFPDAMRIAMLRLAAEWSYRNRMALRWSWVARVRPSERFFWKEFRREGRGRDWRTVSATELCLCAERLKLQLGPAVRAESSSPDGSSRRRREGRPLGVREWFDRQLVLHHMWRLGRIERKARARAMEADSLWQISYNLACLCSLRARLWSEIARRGEPPAKADGSAEACRTAAMQWLERCLDRPASSQLVREWLDADGDLDPLRELPAFVAWSQRVRLMGQAPGGRGRALRHRMSATARRGKAHLARGT